MKMHLIVAALFLTGCTKSCKDQVADVACDAQKKVISGSSAAVASVLECSNPMAIEESLSKMVQGLNICKQTQQDALGKSLGVGQLACPALSGFVVELAADRIPEAWGCKATKVSEDLKAKLEEQCLALVKF